MTVGSPLAFVAQPGSRALAGWWSQLASAQPRALWIAHLQLHRVEALVRVARRCRTDRFTLLLLEALKLEAEGDTLENLDGRLHLGRQVLQRLLHELRAEGLAVADLSQTWSLTPLGHQALDEGEYPTTTHLRQPFHFLDGGNQDRPPCFLALAREAGAADHAPAKWHFDPGLLMTCLSQPSAWKRRSQFPEDVEEILQLEPPGLDQSPETPHWRRVVLNQPISLVAALIRAPRISGAGWATSVPPVRNTGTAPVPLTQNGAEPILGFEIRQEGWTLVDSRPLFTLTDECLEMIPELRIDPPPEIWKKAWRNWCRQRNLLSPEIEACEVRRLDHRLEIVVPRNIAERLRSARGDLFKGEAWLLAGQGRVRTAAKVELVETPS